MTMDLNYKVVVLYDGFSKINEDCTEMEANCTCTLIKGPKNIIVDTMTAWDGDKIVKALQKHNLTPEIIDWVICSHGHSDHVGNNALFQNAIHVVGTSISKWEKYFLHDFESNPEYVIDEKIKILATPGHTISDVSVIVQTKQGVFAIVGDLFERKEDIDDEKLWLKIAGSECPEKQRINRDLILNIADYIIPGHGPLFPVTDDLKSLSTS